MSYKTTSTSTFCDGSNTTLISVSSGCEGTTTNGHTCAFPFIYSGKTYNNCTKDGGYTTAWCAYETTNTRQLKWWDYCDRIQCPGKNKQL